MFVGLKQQLEQGEHFKATLEFAKAGKVDVDFAVEGIGAQSPAPAGAPRPDGRHENEVGGRYFGSANGNSASGGGIMRNTLSVIEIIA